MYSPARCDIRARDGAGGQQRRDDGFLQGKRFALILCVQWRTLRGGDASERGLSGTHHAAARDFYSGQAWRNGGSVWQRIWSHGGTHCHGSALQSGILSPPPAIQIGGTAARASFAGLVSPGEYQFNVVVPANLADGDQSVTATYNGLTTQAGTLITIHH
jgi:hypothetical protein